MPLTVYVAVELGRNDLLDPKVTTYQACPEGHRSYGSYPFCPRCGGAVTERTATAENDALASQAQAWKCTKEEFWERLARGDLEDDSGLRAITFGGKGYVVRRVRHVAEAAGGSVTSTEAIRAALDDLSDFCVDCGFDSLQEDGAQVLIVPGPDEST